MGKLFFNPKTFKSMATAWTVEGSPLRDPGAAPHATNTRMLAVGCARQTAQNVSPESDPVGCASQTGQNVHPESNPMGSTGQTTQNMPSESDTIVCASQTAQHVSPASDL